MSHVYCEPRSRVKMGQLAGLDREYFSPNTRKVKWNTCIPLEYEDKVEYKYVYSTCIPLYSMYSTVFHVFHWNTWLFSALEYKVEYVFPM